jgi:hypothetical protein
MRGVINCEDCGRKKVDCYEEFEVSGALVRWYWCAACYLDRMKLLKTIKRRVANEQRN